MTFIAILKGYDTMEYGSVRRELEVEAETREEAEVKAKEWCSKHSVMGGYDWHVDTILKRIKEK